MTAKQKDDLNITEQDWIVLKEYEGAIACREDLVDLIHFVRQQTAQEIFDDLEKETYVTLDNSKIGFLKEDYKKIKQKYLKEELLK